MKLPEELEEKVERMIEARMAGFPDKNTTLIALRAAEIALEWSAELVCELCGKPKCIEHFSDSVSRLQYRAEREREGR